MADNLRFYKICPCCGGTGVLSWGISPTQSGDKICPRCEQSKDEEHPLGAINFNGLRHVYVGRFEEVED